MSRTKILISARLPSCISAVVINYFGRGKTSYDMAILGQYEDCESRTSNIQKIFRGACRGGHIDIIKMVLRCGAYDMPFGLMMACRGGHLHVIEFMINKSSILSFDFGLAYACRDGNVAIAELMIAHGANDFDAGLRNACRGGHLDLINLMIGHGSEAWNGALAYACRGGQLEIAKLMISKGASVFNWGLASACRGGHLALVDLMEAYGAYDWLTAIEEASRGGHLAMVRMIAERKIYINLHSMLANECMYLACIKGSLDVIRFMIAHGANNWDRGLAFACWFGHIHIAKFMIAKGATDLYKARLVASNAPEHGIIAFIHECEKEAGWWFCR